MSSKESKNTATTYTPIKKIIDLNKRFDLKISDIAAVLDVSTKTLIRWTQKEEKHTLISKQKNDSLDVLHSILELGRDVLGADHELKAWLHSPVFSLEGEKPIDLIKTESGRRRVEEVLRQIEYGII